MTLGGDDAEVDKMIPESPQGSRSAKIGTFIGSQSGTVLSVDLV